MEAKTKVKSGITLTLRGGQVLYPDLIKRQLLKMKGGKVVGETKRGGRDKRKGIVKLEMGWNCSLGEHRDLKD